MSSLAQFVKRARSSRYASRVVIQDHYPALKEQPLLAGILAAYESNSLMPTPVVVALLHEIDKHGLVKDAHKGTKVSSSVKAKLRALEDKLGFEPSEVSDGKSEIRREPKRYTIRFFRLNPGFSDSIMDVAARIMAEKGAKDIPAFEGSAHTYGEAQSFADRVLTYKALANTFAVISSEENGKSMETRIYRGDAWARENRKKASAATAREVKASGKLGNSMRVKQDHAHFSKG